MPFIKQETLDRAICDMQTITLAGCGAGKCLESPANSPRLCEKCELLLTRIAVGTLCGRYETREVA